MQSLLKEFTDLGVRVALDDFGTGYSSLNHLRSFPGASIKIDRSFVRNVCSERHDAAIVRSLIVMAHNLNLKVIAEGVETAEQLAFLRDNDCDAIQGYLIRRPTPAEDIGRRDLLLRPLIPAPPTPVADGMQGGQAKPTGADRRPSNMPQQAARPLPCGVVGDHRRGRVLACSSASAVRWIRWPSDSSS